MAMYIEVTDANAYFATRLHSQVWDQFDNAEREKALTAATRAIDRLRFAGQKHTVYEADGGDEDAVRAAWAAQELEFPRGQDEEVPLAVQEACCEEALALLDGKDPDQELEDLGVISQGYSSVRVTVDRSFVQEHLNSGIVSPRAWRLLKPFILDARDFKINRV